MHIVGSCYFHSSCFFLYFFVLSFFFFFFFFNDTATTEIYTLSLHDALPILADRAVKPVVVVPADPLQDRSFDRGDRKSTRLNSSHDQISYAVFCLKKKKKKKHKSKVDPTHTIKIPEIYAVAATARYVPHATC